VDPTVTSRAARRGKHQVKAKQLFQGRRSVSERPGPQPHCPAALSFLQHSAAFDDATIAI
jgi:hypothetical protein